MASIWTLVCPPMASPPTPDATQQNARPQDVGNFGGEKCCCNCKEECDIAEMTPWSKDLLSCHICKTSYNRRCLRNNKDPAQKVDWKKKKPEDKVAWFRENKRT